MYAIGFLAGCWILLQLSFLPPLWIFLVVVGCCLLVAYFSRSVMLNVRGFKQWQVSQLPLLVACCCLGLFWQAWHCQGLLANRLSADQEGKEVLLVGTISDIPYCDEQHCSFSFASQSKSLNAGTKSRLSVRLSWYGVERHLQVGECWQLAVRLKRPRGTLNPGGFDFEAWSWQHHISGKGYVNHRGNNRYLGMASGYKISRWRARLLQSCQALLVGEPLGGVITALNLGWTQDIPYSQRLVVQRTGTAHLLAISGLHVGMVAGLVAWLLRWAWSLLPRVTEYLPAPTVAAIGAILAAIIYSEMAGFACSTQRACVMCALLFLPKIAHRHMTVKTALFRAVWVVLLWDPCVVQSSGFWLSFMAVFVLVYARYAKDLGRWGQHLEAQWVCLIGLLPLSIWYFHQISLVSVLANLIAIPVVGFLVLPLVLLGSILAIKQAFLAKFIFLCALKILFYLGVGLAWLSQKNWAVWSYSFSHWWEFLLVSSGCALLVFTQKNWRWVGLVGVVPLVLPNTSPVQNGQFKLTVLDVGQGLATVVSTRHHNLIYDTGAKFSSQLDCGQQIVIPYLILEKIRSVDALVVSHGDNDHAGGAMAILQQFPVKKFYTSAVEHFMMKNKNQINLTTSFSNKRRKYSPTKAYLGTEVEKHSETLYSSSRDAELHSASESVSALQSNTTLPTNCLAGTHWEWDGVQFEFLHPPLGATFKSNDRSCVLKVSSQYSSVLFPGDIEKSAELWLSEHYPERLASTVLIVPHHGSKTSSTQNFIAAVHPEVAIISYGYRNRYRHPNTAVVERYQENGTTILNTMAAGAITYTLGSTSPWRLYRQGHHEFWRVEE